MKIYRLNEINTFNERWIEEEIQDEEIDNRDIFLKILNYLLDNQQYIDDGDWKNLISFHYKGKHFNMLKSYKGKMVLSFDINTEIEIDSDNDLEDLFYKINEISSKRHYEKNKKGIRKFHDFFGDL